MAHTRCCSHLQQCSSPQHDMFVHSQYTLWQKLIDWLTDWLTDWLIDWLIDWLGMTWIHTRNELMCCLGNQIFDWLIDEVLLVDWLLFGQTYWLNMWWPSFPDCVGGLRMRLIYCRLTATVGLATSSCWNGPPIICINTPAIASGTVALHRQVVSILVTLRYIHPNDIRACNLRPDSSAWRSDSNAIYARMATAIGATQLSVTATSVLRTALNTAAN